MSIRIPQRADREVQDGLRDADQAINDMAIMVGKLRAEIEEVRGLLPVVGATPSHTNLGDVSINGILRVAGATTLASNTLTAPGQMNGYVGVGQSSGMSAASRVVQVHGSLAVGSVIRCYTIDARELIGGGVRIDHPLGEVSYFDTTGTLVTIGSQSNGLTNMVHADLASALTAFDISVTSTPNRFDNGGSNNGTLRYVGDDAYHFHIACTWSASPATGGDLFVFGIAKNGTILQPSRVLQTLTGSETQGNAIHVATTMSNGDYLQLYVGNVTAARNCTLKTVNLFAMGAHHCHCTD